MTETDRKPMTWRLECLKCGHPEKWHDNTAGCCEKCGAGIRPVVVIAEEKGVPERAPDREAGSDDGLRASLAPIEAAKAWGDLDVAKLDQFRHELYCRGTNPQLDMGGPRPCTCWVGRALDRIAARIRGLERVIQQKSIILGPADAMKEGERRGMLRAAEIIEGGCLDPSGRGVFPCCACAVCVDAENIRAFAAKTMEGGSS